MSGCYSDYYPDIPEDYDHPLVPFYVIHDDSEYFKTISGQFLVYVGLLENAMDNQTWMTEREKNDIRIRHDITAKEILLAYSFACDGRLEEATEIMYYLLRKYKNKYIQKLGLSYAIKCNNTFTNPEVLADDVYFYRGRIIKQNPSFEVDKKELYHIPFDKTSLVKSERFSIQGTPCLYLSCNTAICKTEINDKNGEVAFYAAFKPKSSCLNSNIIDLSTLDPITDVNHGEVLSTNGFHPLTKEEIIQMLRESPSYFLNIACRIKCDQENRTFQSEYVLPHLIMMCLQRLNCIGIVYASTCLEEHHILQSCFAFPAFKKENDNSLYSNDLMDSFLVSDGFNYSQFLKRNQNTIPIKENVPFNKRNQDSEKGYYAHLYNYKDWASCDGITPYYKTENYAFDQFLIQQLESQK
jgi:hypothetical protein